MWFRYWPRTTAEYFPNCYFCVTFNLSSYLLFLTKRLLASDTIIISLLNGIIVFLFKIIGEFMLIQWKHYFQTQVMMIRYGKSGFKTKWHSYQFWICQIAKVYIWFNIVNWLSDMPCWLIIFRDSVFYITDLFLLWIIKKYKLKSLLFLKLIMYYFK